MPSGRRGLAAAAAAAVGLALGAGEVPADDESPFGPTTITADSLEWNEEAAVATAVGNAVARQGGRILRAERFVAHAIRDASGSVIRIGRIEASGGVVYETGNEIARGDTGHYDIEGGRITLSGSVELQRDGNRLRGAMLTIDLVSGTSQMTGAGREQPQLEFGDAAVEEDAP